MKAPRWIVVFVEDFFLNPKVWKGLLKLFCLYVTLWAGRGLLVAGRNLYSGSASDNDLFVLAIAVLLLVLTPGLIAHARHHRNRLAILVCCFICWPVAIVWAFTANTEK